MDNEAEHTQLTWDQVFAWGEEVARRGHITRERSRELLSEVRAMSPRQKSEAVARFWHRTTTPIHRWCSMSYERELGACLRELLGESAFDLPAKRLIPYLYLLQLEGVDIGFDFRCDVFGFWLHTSDEFDFPALMRRAKAASIGAELETWAKEAIDRVRSRLSNPSFVEWLWAAALAEVHFNYTLVMKYSSGDKRPTKDEVYSRMPPEHRIRGLFEYAWNALGLSSQLD